MATATAGYSYDDNGNTRTRTEAGQTTTFNYNAQDRLQTVNLPGGGTATYTYDPFGRRIKKQVGQETTIYIYADEGLIGEYTEAGATKKTYGWRPNGIWGTNPLFMQENGNYFFYHNDHLGTPQSMTDMQGDIVWEATYEAFGKAQVDPESTVTNNLRFPGQYWDEETGLHYNWWRYYDPDSGRYVSKDPIGFVAGDKNLYRYVQNNIVNEKDPYGLCAWDLCFGEAAVATALASGILYYGAPIAADIGKWLGTAIEARINDPAAEKDWSDYKDRYREPPPPNLDPCEMLKWKLRKEERLLQDRKNWDAKWKPGAHLQTYEQSENAIKNLKNKIKNVCTPCKKK